MKKRIVLLEGLLIATMVFSACRPRDEKQADRQPTAVSSTAEVQPKEKNRSKKEAAKKYVPKQVKYQKDDTTQVLVDAEIQDKDIVKIVQHGDHWHVFTSDGRERITYQDPNILLAQQDSGQDGTKNGTGTERGSQRSSGLVFISVVSLADLQGLPVTQIKVHGDHWHVYLQDGTEYLTYENPGASFPHIAITEYTGNHGSSTANRGGGLRLNHMQDPIPQPDVPNGGASQKPSGDVQAWDPNRVVKILQHEDHYHVYTADGREFISYIDPRPYYPNAEFGQYIGSHDDQTARQNQNHDRQGQSVPRPQPDGGRPDGTKPNTQRQNPPKPNDRGQNTPKPNGQSQNTPQPKPQLPGGLHLVTVVDLAGLKKMDVEQILQHDDHYHVYTKDKKEYITYHDPRQVFPKMKIGKYIGHHGKPQADQGNQKPHSSKPQNNPGNTQSDQGKQNQGQGKPNQGKPGHTSPGNDGQNPNKPDRPPVKPIVQDPKDPKRIVRIAKHNDHWHLISADGTEKITYEDPQPYYPDIKIEDYLGEHVKPVDPNELFSYDDVEAELIIPEKALDWYGGMQYAIDFDPIKEEFIVPHLDHFHNISIKTIIGLAKDGKTFKQYTARQVVATLKYWVTHPQERPKKAGWGDQTGQIDEGPAEDYRETELKLAFLRKHYGITSKSDYLRIRDAVEIYVGEETVKVYLSDLKVENGKVIPTVELPKIEKRKVPWPTEENDDSTEDHSATDDRIEEETPASHTPDQGQNEKPDEDSDGSSQEDTKPQDDEEDTEDTDDTEGEDDTEPQDNNDGGADQSDEDMDQNDPSWPSQPGDQSQLQAAADLYGITVEQLEELFLEVVPEGSIYQAVFHANQTVTSQGKTYDLKEGLTSLLTIK